MFICTGQSMETGNGGVRRLLLHLFTYPYQNDDGQDRHYHPPSIERASSSVDGWDKMENRLDMCEQGFNGVHWHYEGAWRAALGISSKVN